MAYFIPASYQKRLLHYALSHFGIIDTDALDLQQLDISWGKRSTIELRDVGLHINVGYRKRAQEMREYTDTL